MKKKFELIPVKFEGFSIISDCYIDLEGHTFFNKKEKDEKDEEQILDTKLMIIIRCPGIREEQCNSNYITIKHIMKENSIYISVKIEPPKYNENFIPINPALLRLITGKYKCEPPEMYTIMPYKTEAELFKNVKILCGDIYIYYDLRADTK